jgi:Cu2+-exporting ATPase
MSGTAGGRDPTRCFHCGEPVPSRTPWRTPVDGAEAVFCCAGCLAVAQTIGAAGLSSFYALRDRDSVPQRDGGANEDQARDAAAASTWLEAAHDEVTSVALLLDGMRCGACVWLIESFLQRQPGVLGARINFATRRAQLCFDRTTTTLSAVLAAVSRIGYRAYPYDPRRREAMARRESRQLLLRTSLALLAMMQVMMLAAPGYISSDGVDPEQAALLNLASLVLSLPVVFYCAAPFFVGAWRDLRRLRPGMDVPIALGIGAAFTVSVWATFTRAGAVYFDSVTMFVALVLAARLLELRVREKAGDALESIARDTPQMADRLDRYPDGQVCERIVAASVAVGSYVRIAAGAPVPVDGIVVEGCSSVEEAILTGESWPRAKGVGDCVMAGSINRDSPLIVRATSAGYATMLAALSQLVERAANERPRLAKLSDRAAMAFVVSLLAIAALSAGAWLVIDPPRALPVAFAVLVVSCPCALSLATPAALAAVAGALGRRHILCVRPDTIEALSRVTDVVLDKTGTLTTGEVRLTGITTYGAFDADRCNAIAAALEAGASHPIAHALAGAARSHCVADDIVAVPGCGVEGTVDGIRYRLGRAEWVAGMCIAAPPGDEAAANEISIALGSRAAWLARLRFGDPLRPGAGGLVTSLRDMGLTVSMISGDRDATVRHVADTVGIGDWRASASPDDKRAYVGALQAKGAIVAIVGDGINDAAALARADVSIALGNAATLTQWTADAVVLGSDLARVAFALRAARQTFRVIRQNIGWAIGYNVIAIPLAACDLLSPLAAAVGMSVSSLVVVGNAWRLSRLSRSDDVAKHANRAVADSHVAASNRHPAVSAVV